MRCVSGVFLVLLLLSPDVILSARRTQEKREKTQSESKTGVPPIAMLVAGTVSVAGTLFSLHKHRKQLAMDKKRLEAAKELVRSYKDQQNMGCSMLDQTGILLNNKRKGLQRLAEDGRSGTHSLSSSCLYDARMKHFESNLREQLRATCGWLDVDEAPTALRNFSARCLDAANFDHLSDRICEENGNGLTHSMHRTDLIVAKLDGVMAGLCDGLPGFKRTFHGIDEEGASASSLVAREVNASKHSPDEIDPLEFNMGSVPTGPLLMDPLEVLEMIALGYGILGTMDFGMDLYESAVRKNDGYHTLLNVVKEDAYRQHQLLWNSFQVYWLDVAWMRSVQLATLAERYQEASLSLPEHLLTMTRAATPMRWHDYGANVKEGSYWACNRNLKCLVPVWHATANDGGSDSADRTKLSDCATSFGDLRMCRTDGVSETRLSSHTPQSEADMHAPLTEFAMAPRRCFGIHFGCKGCSAVLTRNTWVYHFASNEHVQAHSAWAYKGQPGDEYNIHSCLEPLLSLAQSTIAEEDLRKSLIDMSKQTPENPWGGPLGDFARKWEIVG